MCAAGRTDWYGTQVGAHGVYDVVITTTWATDNQPFLVAAMGLRLLQLASVEVTRPDRPPLLMRVLACLSAKLS